MTDEKPSTHARSNTIQGILFDKDGTLIDFYATWMPAYRAAVEAVCIESGKPELAAQLLEVAGYNPLTQRCDPASLLACGTTVEIAKLWAEQAGLDNIEPLTNRIEEIFYQATARPVAVRGLKSLMRRLTYQGCVLGVATMDSEASAQATLNRLQVMHHFDFVCGYDSGFGLKPGPGMVKAFCEHTGLAPEQVAVVGDTPHDLHMGRAARAGLVIGVLSGASPVDMLNELADHVLPNIIGMESLLF